MQASDNRLAERIPFNTENSPLIHEMPTKVGIMATESTLLLAGSLVVSGGTTSGTALGENPGGLLQQVQVEATALTGGYPDGTLKKIVPRTLMRRRIFDHPEKRFVPDVSLGINGLTGAAGTFTLNMPFKLHWALPWLKRPFDTALDTGMFSSILWTITNGSRDRQFSGNDRVFNYAGVYWNIWHMLQAYSGGGNGPCCVLYDSDTTKNISGANPRLELNKEFVVDGSYLDLLFMTETTNQVLADTIMNKLTIASGNDDFFNFYAPDLKAEMEGIIGDASTTSSPRTGLYWAQVANDGLITNAKPNISATIDQANPGTDRFIISRRSHVYIPGTFRQTGNGTVKTGARSIKVA
jgi:hypothetical protein